MGTNHNAVKHQIRLDPLNKIIDLLSVSTWTAIGNRARFWGIVNSQHVRDTVLYLWTIRYTKDWR